MSEKKTTPCMKGLASLTEAELDAASGGVPFRGIIRASFLSSVSSFVSEARSEAYASRTSATSSATRITVTQSNVSSASNGTVTQSNASFIESWNT